MKFNIQSNFKTKASIEVTYKDLLVINLVVENDEDFLIQFLK